VPCGEVTGEGEHADCLSKADLRVAISYQPASRYWDFQWYETGLFLVLTIGLGGFTAWWLRRKFA
jgi:hypothetical protein